MTDFMANSPIPRPASAQHARSQSSTTPKSNLASATTETRVGRVNSTSALHTMRLPIHAQQSHLSQTQSHYNDDDQFLSTIPDPRSRSTSPANGLATSPSQHPDLNDEVAKLSSKLIAAINHQTTLDDTLNSTRHELEISRERQQHLEAETDDYRKQISSGALVRSIVVRKARMEMDATILKEKKAREEAEQATKKMETELENLTSALFEEANKMVISAREVAKREQDIVQKKNDQLRAQLADTEGLLRSHQEQLAELKNSMEQLNANREEERTMNTPSTPAMIHKFMMKDDIHGSRPTSGLINADMPASYPTSFTHLIQPVLRTDLAAYEDFTSLLRMSKMFASGSRASSGSYSLGLGLGLGGYGNSATNSASTNGSASSIGSSNPSPITPTTPASSVGSNAASLPLKDTRFYKRALAEDIDPTLRLDTAPGLSWLARRSVLSAMCDGTLVVEPMPTHSNAKYLSAFPCSLCGEARKTEEHIRTHRFRTSESESAQRYSLCKYCLGRVRSCCDFLGFLRVLKDGHWRTDDEESEKAAWEESVRLREQMFWCRVGGGVVPVVAHSDKSIVSTIETDREKEMMESIAELERTGEIRPRDITPLTNTLRGESDVLAIAKKVDLNNGSTSGERHTVPESDLQEARSHVQILSGEEQRPDSVQQGKNSHDTTVVDAVEKHIPADTTSDSVSPNTLHSPSTPEQKRLSLSIPGSFD